MALTCAALVRGDYRSPNGTNRYDFCEAPARFTVIRAMVEGEGPYPVCGRHVRTYRAFNESQWRTDDVLKRPRRPPYYVIEALA